MKLKVITLNIWEGEYLDQAIGFLQSENPDIVLLQEVYGDNGAVDEDKFRTFEVLKDRLELAYADFIPGLRHRRPEGKFLQGNAIFSRFPVTATDYTFFNDPFNDDFEVNPANNPNFPHVLQHAEIEADGRTVNVFNVHGTWDLDGDNYSEKRKQMSRAIIHGVRGKQLVILAGDTNAKPTNQAMRDVEGHLQSVFGNELTSTFNMKHKDNPGYATAAVDMMFISRDITVLDKRCPAVDVSDHLPLVVTLSF